MRCPARVVGNFEGQGGREPVFPFDLHLLYIILIFGLVENSQAADPWGHFWPGIPTQDTAKTSAVYRLPGRNTHRLVQTRLIRPLSGCFPQGISKSPRRVPCAEPPTARNGRPAIRLALAPGIPRSSPLSRLGMMRSRVARITSVGALIAPIRDRPSKALAASR